MTRFEIQEIAYQNQEGITFLALDKTTQQTVALRRFFPFGQNYLEDEEELEAEGLGPIETKAFSSACERLSTINHPALRKTLFGSADPVDGMPYLVTEWIDGESLSSVLGHNVLEPAAVIDLIRLALEVCQVLSSTLESEAVWIDTKKDAIIVCDASVNPTFSFRICPFKWLGTQTHHKDLTGIVQLVEELIGWKSRLVSDQAGLGLGGWLKLLRQNPEMSLQEAIDTLPDPYAQPAQSQIPVQALFERPAQPLVLASTNPFIFNVKSLSIIAISACLTIGLIFFLYQWNVRKLDSTAAAITGKSLIVEQQSETLEADTTIPSSQTTIPSTETIIPSTETTPLPITSWSPIEIVTAAWYDASNTATITSSNGSVFQWNDISGNNGHATQSSNDFQPKTGTRTIHDLNAIDFDADQLNRFEMNMNGKAMFAIVSPDEDGGQIFSHSNINNQLTIQSGGQVTYAAIPTRYKDHRASTEKLAMNKPGMVGYLFNTTLQYSVNGVFEDTGIAETSSVGSAFNQFGGCLEKSELLDSLVGEIIITESIPDTDTRQKIEGYLAHKWRITENLPADHPYKLSVPASMGSDVKPLNDPPVIAKTSNQTETVQQKTGSWSAAEMPPYAWYDASKATIKDGTVSIVNAVSRGDMISGPASLAANGIGNLQAVQFNGINEYLIGDYSNTGQTLSVFFVGKSSNKIQEPYAGMLSVWDSGQKFDWDNPTSAVLFSQNNTIENSIYTHRSKLIQSSATGMLTNGFLAATVFNGSTNTLFLNGIPSTSVPSLSSFNTSKLILGGRWQSNMIAKPFWNGSLGEVIIFNSDLSTSDRQKIEGYLANKWSLVGSLPEDHPYKSSAPTTTPQVLEILSPQNTDYIKTLKAGDPVTLVGTVSSAKLSSTEKSIYISFSDPVVETGIRVVIHGSEYEGSPFTEAGFAPLIGQTLVFSGTVYTEPFNDRPPFVKITEKTQIKLATSEDIQKSAVARKSAVSNGSKPEAVSDIPVFTPDDFEAIAKLELKKPAAVKGIIKSVNIPKAGNGMYFAFSDPWDGKQIRVVAYPKWFEGKNHKDNEFKSIEKDLQRLVGKTVFFEGRYVTQAGNNNRHFVYITSLNQIKETE